VNTVAIDVTGAGLPFVVALAYVPRTWHALDAITLGLYVPCVAGTVAFSWCGPDAVHVAPGPIALVIALWLLRVAGRTREVPAACVFALTVFALLPADLYGALSCPSQGIALVGAAGFSDALLRTPLVLAMVHGAVSYFLERDESARVPLGAFVRRQLALS
jgi:hypothetical protein